MKRRALAGILPALVLLSACEVPTTTPDWDMTWNVPAKDTTISVDKFLPVAAAGQPAVTVTSDKSAFQFTPAAVTVQRLLATDCPGCPSGTFPKPAFTGTGSNTAALPAGVSSATILSGTLSIAIANGFTFDPIHPSPTALPGYIIIAVTNGAGASLGRDSIPSSGPGAVSIPAGGTLATPRSIALSGVIDATGIKVTVTVTSPATTEAIPIDPSKTITFTVTPSAIKLSTATVTLASQALPASSSNIDLSGIDNTITSRVNSGSLIMAVTNPFAVGGTMTITFTGGSQVVTKTITLTAASGATPSTTTQTVTLSSTEISAILGHDVTMTFGGTIAGTTAVTPSQSVSVSTRLQLNVSTKSSQ